MRTLSPEELAQAVRYATDWFAVYVEETNALNVYPVPDGDTGTNMHLTLQSVRRELDLIDTARMPEVARALAYGSLLGARGNSGVILSQILKGYAEVLRRREALDPDALVDALKRGAEAAYRAVMKPVEGTILTVARAAAEGAEAARGAGVDTLEGLLQAAQKAAQKALERTPELLPVLKTAGVVDAGGMGYLRFLEGLLGFLEARPLPEPPKVERYAQEAFEEEEYGYCTEFLMEGVEAPIEEIRRAVAPFGDSLLVVGAEGFVKGHIHTNEPDALLATVARYGRMRRTKVEDMSEQHSEILAAVGAAEEPPPPTGLVAVAPGWGLAKAFRGLGARVVAGGQTQNPSVEDLLDALRAVPSEEVVLLPNNKNVILAAERAAALAGERLGKRVRVLPTRTLGAGLAAAVAFDENRPAEAILPAMEAAAEHARTLEVTRASRDARTEEVGEVSEGQVIGLLDGKLKLVAETPEEALLELLRLVLVPEAEYEVLTLFTGPGMIPEASEALSQKLAAYFPELETELHPGGPELYDLVAVLE